MKRIESCPSIVDSVSFFDNDANIADQYCAQTGTIEGLQDMYRR